jgi:hypothetical protein
MGDFGILFFKIVLLMLASPLWLPVVKAIWEEANHALADEGGILGRPPSPAELERMNSEAEWRPDPLVHEPWGTGAGAKRRAATIQEKEGSKKGSARKQRRGSRDERGPRSF